MNILKQFVFQAGLLALIVAGHAYQIDGARHLAAFVIWVVLLPGSILVNVDGVIEAAAKEPKRPTLWRGLSLPMFLASLGVLVWFGATFTAVAYALSLLLCRIAVAAIEKARAQA